MFTFDTMIAELLKNDKASIDAFFSCHQEQLGKSLKIIQHKISVSDFLPISARQWRKLTQSQFTSNSDTYYIQREDTTTGLGKHWLHGAGFFYIQEVAASLPASCISAKKGEILLDMCAAPGGKSTQIADTGAFVVSNEVSGSRIVALQHNLNRTSSYNTAVTSIQGWDWWIRTPLFFDHVLVDAPCSWEWTGFKSDAGTKRWREEQIHQIARLQKDLLTSAIKACKVGWTIIYSTCTINPRENEGVIADALEKFGNDICLAKVDIPKASIGITSREGKNLLTEDQASMVARFWPHIQQTWGFFIAKIQKIANSFIDASDNSPKKTTPLSQLDVSDALQERISTILNSTYGITINPHEHFFVWSQKQIYLTHPLYKNVHSAIYSEKTGIPIFKVDGKELRPLHWLWNCLWHLATRNTLSLPENVLQPYSEGFDIPRDTSWWEVTASDKYCILKRWEYGISVGKIVWDTLKNKFAK